MPLWQLSQGRTRKRHKTDFENGSKADPYYDIYEDWPAIEASFAQQYGIRLRHEKDMPWSEFSFLLGNLDAKSPLGQIVSVRSETDPERLKLFSPEQMAFRRDWLNRQALKRAKTDRGGIRKELDAMQNALKEMFGKEG